MDTGQADDIIEVRNLIGDTNEEPISAKSTNALVSEAQSHCDLWLMIDKAHCQAWAGAHHLSYKWIRSFTPRSILV